MGAGELGAHHTYHTYHTYMQTRPPGGLPPDLDVDIGVHADTDIDIGTLGAGVDVDVNIGADTISAAGALIPACCRGGAVHIGFGWGA